MDVHCRNCGGTVSIFEDATGVLVCPLCGAPVGGAFDSIEEARAALSGVPGAEHAIRRAERELAAAEKEQKRQHLASREAEVRKYNEELETHVGYLAGGILSEALEQDSFLDFDWLKESPPVPEFQPGPLAVAEIIPEFSEPPALSWSQMLIPGAKARWEARVEAATRDHAAAVAAHAERERAREQELEQARIAHERLVAEMGRKAELQLAEIEEFRQAFEQEQPEAVVRYFSLVLSRSGYPEAFPNRHRLAFVPESRQLVVECELPSLSVVPALKQRRFVKTQDRVEDVPRPARQVKALYAKVIAQVALRALHEVFEADRGAKAETVVLNGHVDTVDRATGRAATPCLVTLRTTRDAFLGIDLSRVEPEACLRGLGASVSRDPAELAPVRPVLDLKMVDSRFIEETDVLSGLDQRPNLMELSPSEFENLITNLFQSMGLDTRLTQASRDGGVDCVAYDCRPVLGGKVVIQAKRYKNTVGVGAVRDLYGTMLNEGASKGILVTTSGYGKAAFEFANDKPMELLDGGNLLYLLKEHAGMDAKIVVPEDWVDPTLDE